jgi:hypothetical protein
MSKTHLDVSADPSVIEADKRAQVEGAACLAEYERHTALCERWKAEVDASFATYAAAAERARHAAAQREFAREHAWRALLAKGSPRGGCSG